MYYRLRQRDQSTPEVAPVNELTPVCRARILTIAIGQIGQSSPLTHQILAKGMDQRATMLPRHYVANCG
jgi:hypothetical protein